MPLFASSSALPPRTVISSDMYNSSRYYTNNVGAGSSVTQNAASSGSLSMHKGTTSTGGAMVKDNGGLYNSPIWDYNPSFWGSADGGNFNAADSYTAYLGMDGIVDANTFIVQSKYMGFKIVNNAGTAQVYAVHRDGTNAEVSTLLSLPSSPQDNTFLYQATMISGSQINYYVNQVLYATHTTQLPSGVMTGNCLYGAGGKATAGTDDQTMLIVRFLGVSYDAHDTTGVAPNVDVTPPIISSKLSTQVGGADANGHFTVTVTWTTDEPATSQVQWTQGGPTYTTTQDPSLVTSHSVTINSTDTNAPSAGSFTATVYSNDASANAANSAAGAITLA